MKKHAEIRRIQGLTFIGKADSGHWTVIDGPGENGGSGGGPRPKELLLLSLAGCTGSDVASILTKKRVPFSGLEVHVTGEVRETHPQVFTDLHVEYVIFGEGINPKDVERSIQLSETTYCAVSAMLRPAVNITSSYRIEPDRNNGVAPQLHETTAMEQ